ncbi:MAG: hypothetical protein IK141_04205 [Clostridia bacterium]|nr:hypothetical protein [Clostridia bacterium]
MKTFMIEARNCAMTSAAPGFLHNCQEVQYIKRFCKRNESAALQSDGCN